MERKEKKNKYVAAILAGFFGSFGVHRFYLGQNSMGVGYLLGTFSIIGLPIVSLISWVDLIGFLIMPEDRFDERYNGALLANARKSFIGQPTSVVNVADEIRKLDALFTDGIITFEEYERRKQRLINL
ncbi:NINE protein [Eisenibacter elegans]|jgi:TM2 domain-containing membrane protein YozV|uniref:NINE protein n=1 Tax=Eisenibacter elegans TaxID=997 RepID=UPI000408273E|nr:NINE protein [Eisenibacter elegans]